ncbi:hypothetical protein TNCV_1746831 [Trichonephila clavipes]|nr:hypothetical protein TNCV_1746831 [Trichonephila clavipes]
MLRGTPCVQTSTPLRAGVHFKSKLGTHTNKKQDLPDTCVNFLRRSSIKISETATQVYIDGSKNEHNFCDILVKASNFSQKVWIRNPDLCSVFKSELIAIDVVPLKL